MDRKTFRPPLATFGLACALLAAGALGVACGSKPVPAETGAGDPPSRSGDAGRRLYQCSMHPNVVSDHPGKCPICGMDLQPVQHLANRGIPGRGAVRLSPRQRQLIDVRVAPVGIAAAATTVRAVGIVAYDETRVAEVNSRVMGWVERLYVDEPGQLVRARQPLLALYSPELYSAQQEYLLALQQVRRLGNARPASESEDLRRLTAASRDGARSLLAAARTRLELWEISDGQIRALERSGEPKNTMELTAPTSGYVVEKNVVPKQMIHPGDPLYRIADLSRVWLNAEIYESELPSVRVGQKAAVTVDAYPGKIFAGRVDFIYPYLETATRTVKVRLAFDNREGLLKPGMYATAVLADDLGERLVVPSTAVFDTGERRYVFVEAEAGVFEPREVRLGPETGDGVVVAGGLRGGEKIAVDGNFLLDSESQLRAAAETGPPAEAPKGGGRE